MRARTFRLLPSSLALLILLGVAPALGAQSAELEERGRTLVEQAETAQLAGDVSTAAISYFNAGQLYFNARLFAPARQCFEKLEPLATQLNHPVILAAAHVYLGAVLSTDRELEAAAVQLERGLGEAREIGHDQLALLGSSRLGDVYRNLGRLADARAHYEEARELMLAAGDDRNRIAILSQVARVDLALGDFEAAASGHAAALELAGRVGDDSATTSAFIAAGQFEQILGHYLAAERHFSDALAVAPQRELEAVALGQLGNVEKIRGRFGEALTHFDACLAIAREIGDLRLEVTSLASLGITLSEIGQPGDASVLLKEALAMLPEGFDPAVRAELLVQLGTTRRRDPDPAPARAAFVEARDLARTAEQAEIEFRAIHGLLTLEYDQGDYRAAMELATDMGTLVDEVPHGLHPTYLGNVADLHLRLGEPGIAQARALDAIESAREREGTWHSELGPRLVHLEASLALDDLDQAEDSLQRVEAYLGATAVLGLPPDAISKLRSLNAYAECGEFAQDLTAKRGALTTAPAERADVIRTGFQRADLWKGQALLAGISEHRSGARSVETVPLRRDLRNAETAVQTARVGLAKAVRVDALGADTVRRREELAALTARRDELQARLSELAPREAAFDVPVSPTPEQLAAEVLGGRGRLIEFVEGKQALGAYVITPDGISRHELGDREAIRADVLSFIAGLTDPFALADVAEIASRGGALYDTLLRPLLGEVRGPGHEDGAVVLVPSPTLAGLPFEALVTDTSTASPTRFDELTFVLERHLVAYGPSSSVLALLAETPARTTGGTALVLADPTYVSEAESPSGALAMRTTVDIGHLPRLLGTRSEARAIARGLGVTTLFDDDARSGTFRDEHIDLRLGAEASPSALGGNLRGHRLLHFATHALLDPQDPRRSGLVLSPTEDTSGFVSLADLLELDLDADLTVLSACETARGEVQRAEGVQSLARAFLHAGSRSVVASLWRVNDLATAELMAVFYRGLLTEGRPPAEALRRAQLSLLRGEQVLLEPDERGGLLGGRSRQTSTERSTAHPYAWAAFVYNGLPD